MLLLIEHSGGAEGKAAIMSGENFITNVPGVSRTVMRRLDCIFRTHCAACHSIFVPNRNSYADRSIAACYVPPLLPRPSFVLEINRTIHPRDLGTVGMTVI